MSCIKTLQISVLMYSKFDVSHQQLEVMTLYLRCTATVSCWFLNGNIEFVLRCNVIAHEALGTGEDGDASTYILLVSEKSGITESLVLNHGLFFVSNKKKQLRFKKFQKYLKKKQC